MKIQLAHNIFTKPQKMLSHYRLGSSLRIFLTFAKILRTILEFSKWHKPTKKKVVSGREAEPKRDLFPRGDTFKGIAKLNFALCGICACLFSGCFTHIVKEPVYIPTKCEISMPLRPNFHSNTAQNVKDLLIYTQELENDLRFCINGEVF